MKYMIMMALFSQLVACSSQPAQSSYDVSREERLYDKCMGQVSDLTADNRRVISVDGSIRAASGCVGVAKQLR